MMFCGWGKKELIKAGNFGENPVEEDYGKLKGKNLMGVFKIKWSIENSHKN